MAYPIDNLTSASSEDERNQAMAATIAQMQQEGMSPEMANTKAQELMAAMMGNTPMMSTRRKMVFRSSGAFAGNSDSMGGSSSPGFASVMNPRLGNFNPNAYP